MHAVRSRALTAWTPEGQLALVVPDHQVDWLLDQLGGTGWPDHQLVHRPAAQ